MNLLLAALASIITSGVGRTGHRVDLEIYPVKPAASIEGADFQFESGHFLSLSSTPAVTITGVEELEDSSGELRYALSDEAEQRMSKAAKKLRGRQAAVVREGRVIAVTGV